MTKFVAALLVAAGGVKTEVDPHVPGAGETGPFQPSALAAARQRAADTALMAELAAALREVPGEETARNTGRETWHARQRGGGTP